MAFSKYLKNCIKIENICYKTVNIDKIKCQFNPDRFQFYKICIKHNNRDLLKIKYSPHVDLINLFFDKINKIGINNFDMELFSKNKDSYYYKMQKLYGRDDAWIEKKIFKFINMAFNFDLSKQENYPIILDRPIQFNEYTNSGNYEIWEGHHRLAICYVKKINNPKVNVSRWIER